MSGIDEPEERLRKDDDFNLKYFLFKYLRYWPFFALSITLGLVAAYYYNWYATPVYQLQSSILINVDNSALATEDLFQKLDGFSNGSRNLENEKLILQSRQLTAKALEELEFDVSYFLMGDIKTTERYKKTPFTIACDTLEYPA